MLTATTLKKPMTIARMPEARSRRQNGRPNDFWLVASLFMFPSMLSPSTVIEHPRATKPWLGLSNGQLRAK